MPHTAESVVWSAFAAETDAELDQCRNTLLTQVPAVSWGQLVDLPPQLATRYFPRMSPMRAIAKARTALRADRRRARLDDLEVAAH